MDYRQKRWTIADQPLLAATRKYPSPQRPHVLEHHKPRTIRKQNHLRSRIFMTSRSQSLRTTSRTLPFLPLPPSGRVSCCRGERSTACWWRCRMQCRWSTALSSSAGSRWVDSVLYSFTRTVWADGDAVSVEHCRVVIRCLKVGRSVPPAISELEAYI